MNGAVSPLLRTGRVRHSEDMTNATTSRTGTAGPAFVAVQLMPAPVTILSLAIAGSHHLGSVPLAVIAIVGALATLGSALVPASRSSVVRRAMPAPREDDRIS
jgi:hypothetical protein